MYTLIIKSLFAKVYFQVQSTLIYILPMYVILVVQILTSYIIFKVYPKYTFLYTAIALVIYF